MKVAWLPGCSQSDGASEMVTLKKQMKMKMDLELLPLYVDVCSVFLLARPSSLLPPCRESRVFCTVCKEAEV